jgi:hypothetical protein
VAFRYSTLKSPHGSALAGGQAAAYLTVTEAGRSLSSVFESIPANVRFKQMGRRIPRTEMSCKNRTFMQKLVRLVSLQTVHAQDCYGAYWTQRLVDCYYDCLVGGGSPDTYTDSTQADACSGHDLEGGYCGACDFIYDTAGCYSCL